MKEEYVDELDDTLDDVEPVVDNPAELYEHFRVVVDKGQSQVRVDKYLFERLVNSSRNRIQKAADAGLIMANGKPVKSSYKVKPCDVLTVMVRHGHTSARPCNVQQRRKDPSGRFTEQE